MNLLKKQLKFIEQASNSELQKYVINYVLDHYETDDEIKCFFNDLARSGCEGGMICELIYYADTHAFYDTFYDEIEELRCNWEEQVGETLKPKHDLKNWYAWFAFEETARELAINLKIYE
jgi:hypothetical protein